MTKQPAGPGGVVAAADTSFWAGRLRRGISMGEPHRAVADESKEWWDAANARSGGVIRQLLDFYRPSSVLDAGCGIGALCEFVPRDVTYVGVDFVPELIEYAESAYDAPRREFFTADLRDLKMFHANQFGLVICRSVEGTVRAACGAETWKAMEKELTRVSATVAVSMGLYRPGRFDLIRKGGARFRCVDSDPEEEEGRAREAMA
jgi:SAM-dependent methyltransferase